jgi:hypothetical protein
MDIDICAGMNFATFRPEASPDTAKKFCKSVAILKKACYTELRVYDRLNFT